MLMSAFSKMCAIFTGVKVKITINQVLRLCKKALFYVITILVCKDTCSYVDALVISPIN